MFRHARHLALSATLCGAALLGCHSNKPAQGAVAVQLPNGTTEVIPAGQPIPVGATVIASGNSPSPALAPSAPVAAPVAPSDAPTAPGTSATAPTTSAPAYSTPGSSAPTAASAPAAEPAPAPALVVPAGTRVSIRTTETLSAEHGGGVGSSFSGVLNSPVVVHGTTVFGRGTAVRGEIVSAKGRGHFKGAGILGIELTEIGNHRVDTSEYVARVKGRGKRTAGFIGGGAGLGALIGGLAGGGKGALIGGLAGAGGGTAASAYIGSRDVVIPSESLITFRLRNSIRM